MNRKGYLISSMLLSIFTIGFALVAAWLYHDIPKYEYTSIDNIILIMIFLNSVASLVSCCGFIVTTILFLIGGKNNE